MDDGLDETGVGLSNKVDEAGGKLVVGDLHSLLLHPLLVRLRV
jgi:hypothetical protein